MATPQQTYGGYEVSQRLSARVPEPDLRVESFVATRSSEPEPRKRFLLHVIAVEQGGDPDALEGVRVQVERYRLLEHPALSPVLDVIEEPDALVVVMPFEDGVRLDGLRRFLARDKEQLPDPAVWFVGWQIFGALAAGHLARDQHGMLIPLIHGALTMNRMLVTPDGDLRVQGLCTWLDYDDQSSDSGDDGDGGAVEERARRSSIVPQAWWAPEVREGNTAHPPSDVYSAALILRSLLAGLPQPIPGASIQPLAEARPDLPSDITTALDRAVLRSEGQSPASAADLSARFEGIARVSNGKKALRATMDLRRALGGLWSVAAPEAWVDSRSPSEAPPPVDEPGGVESPEEEPLEQDEGRESVVILEDAVLDEAAMERLNLLTNDASPESLQILDEATSDVAAEVDGIIALEPDDMPAESLPLPLEASSAKRVPEDSTRPLRRPTPPPLPRSELLGDHDGAGMDEPAPATMASGPLSDQLAEHLHDSEPDVAPPETEQPAAEQFDPEPLSEIPDAEAPSEIAGAEPTSEILDSEPFSEIPETEPAPEIPYSEPPAEIAAAPAALEREKRESAAPIELSRLAGPVLSEGDDLGPMDGGLDDTQPDIAQPSSFPPPNPFLLPNTLLQRAQDELDREHVGDAPRVEVMGHFEVAGDPSTDAFGDEVARLAPRKRRTRTLEEARARALRNDSEPPEPPIHSSGAERVRSLRPPEIELEEEGGLTRWLVFAAVALSVGVATWYGSLPPKPEALPPLRGDDVGAIVMPRASTQGNTQPVSEPVAPSAPTGLSSAVATPSSATPEEATDDLLSFEAYLTITSTADADVFLKGKYVGSTNRKNRVRCGKSKHVRLRMKSPPPDKSPWLGAGRSIPVPCMKTSTHSIEPEIDFSP